MASVNCPNPTRLQKRPLSRAAESKRTGLILAAISWRTDQRLRDQMAQRISRPHRRTAEIRTAA